MQDKETYKFAICFPENFEKEILPPEAKKEEIPVYRVAKSGKIEEETFLSTYEEIQLGIMENKNLSEMSEEELRKPELYSTSCYLTLSKIKKTLNLMMRHYPQPIIIQGVTKYGIAQRTGERTGDFKDKHVDWWIFRDFNKKLISEFEIVDLDNVKEGK